MINKDMALQVINIYQEAWVKKDPDKILTIFTEDAVYHERPLEEPFVGHKGIKKYWIEKVVNSQDNIKFKLLNLYIDRNVCIAEWEVTFDDIQQQKKKHMREVAILEFRDNLIKSLREYWYSKSYPICGG